MATQLKLDEAPGTDIVAAVTAKPAIVLLDNEKFDVFYEALKAKAPVDADVTTKKGRDALRTFAADVRSEKASIDRDRLRLTKEWRDMTSQVNVAGKEISERLEALAADIRAPLTAWEEAEKARVEWCQKVIADLKAGAVVTMDDTAETVRNRGAAAWNVLIKPETFGDMFDEAVSVKDATAATLKAALARLTKEEADRAELERLREAEAERTRVEAEKAAAEEAARRAEEEARATEARRLAAAQAEKDRIAAAEKAAEERARQQVQEAARAEQARKDAEAQAKIDEANARAAEAERLAQAERGRIAEVERQREVREAAELAVRAGEIPHIRWSASVEPEEVDAPVDAPKSKSSGVTYHADLIQGSDAWLAARCGLLTASEMGKIITAKTLKVADNNDTRTHLWELLCQRLTGFVEPQYVSDAMLRGQEDEIYARAAYDEHYGKVVETGFVTNDRWGFVIGYSPDGLVGDDGLIECKSRAGKYQVQTIAENEVPAEYMIQLQTGLLVSERKWIDFISYSGGLPVFVKRVEADPLIQGAILAAAHNFELRLAERERDYRASLAAMPKLIPTERRADSEIIL